MTNKGDEELGALEAELEELESSKADFEDLDDIICLVSDLTRDSAALKEVVSYANTLSQLVDNLDVVRKRLEAMPPEELLKELEDLYESYKSTRKRWKDLKLWLKEFDGIEQQQIRVDESIEHLEEQLLEIEMCPLCGRQLDKSSTAYMLGKGD